MTIRHRLATLMLMGMLAACSPAAPKAETLIDANHNGLADTVDAMITDEASHTPAQTHAAETLAHALQDLESGHTTPGRPTVAQATTCLVQQSEPGEESSIVLRMVMLTFKDAAGMSRYQQASSAGDTDTAGCGQ